MCSLQRIHDSDPTPTIISPIPPPSKWEPLDPPGVVRSSLESFEVVRSRSESESPGDTSYMGRTTPDNYVFEWLRATPDDSGPLRIMQGGPIFRSRIRIYRSRIGVDSKFLLTLPITSCLCRSWPKSPGVVQSRSKSAGIGVGRRQLEPSGAMFLWSGISFRCVFLSFTLRVHFVYSALRPPTSDESEPLRTTLNKSKQLQTTPDDSGLFRTPPDDSERLRIMLGGSTFRSRFQNYQSRMGVDSEFLPNFTLHYHDALCI